MTSDLVRGPIVFLDDEIDKTGLGNKPDINRLITSFKDEGFPCATFNTIPDDAQRFINNLSSISFLALDWRMDELGSDTSTAGIGVPDYIGDNVVELIKEVRARLFLPIFIFTNEAVEDVTKKLRKANLYDPKNENENFIFIIPKADLLKNNIQELIEKSLRQSPSIYVLKKWEKEHERAKANLFNELYESCHHWPKILWEVGLKDDGLPSESLRNIVTQNLETRMTPLEFEDEVVTKGEVSNDPKEVRKVLEGARYVKNDNLHCESILPGDLFCTVGNDGKKTYRINIRASCDTARNKNPELYLIRGKNYGSPKKTNFQNNNYIEPTQKVIISNIEGKRAMEFDLNKLEIIKWDEIKQDRVGRLLDPHLQRLQQKFGGYIQRQGVPGIPWQALFNADPN